MVLPIDGGGRDTLYAIYTAIREVARRISDLGGLLEEVPVLGDLLAWPLRGVANFLFHTSTVWIDFYHGYYVLVDAVKAMVNGEGSVASLDVLFPSWRSISTNPLVWLLDVVSPVFPSVHVLVFTPLSWLREKLLEAYPDLGLFLIDPREWLAYWLMGTAPILYYVVRGEWGFVNEALYLLYPWTRYIFDDWREWLRLRVGEILGVEYRFWHDPVGHIKEYVLAQRDTWTRNSSGWIKTMGESVLRFLIEGVW